MKRIRFHSIQWKIFIITLFIALCVMGLSLALSYVASLRTIERTTANFFDEYIQFADDNLSGMVSRALAASLTIASDRDLVSDTIADSAVEASYQWYQKKKSLESFLSGIIADKPYIQMANVMVADGRIYQSGDPLMLRRELESEWFQSAVKQQRGEIRYEMQSSPPRVLISRPIATQRGTQAVALLELDYKMLTEAYDIRPLQRADIYLYTPEGELFFTNAEAETVPDYREFTDENRQETGMLSVDYEMVAGVRSFVARYRSSVTGLATVGVIPEKVLVNDAIHISEQIGGISLVCVLLAALASTVFSFFVCRNLNMLTRSMKKVHNDQLHVRVDLQSKDEIGELAETFNSMMNRIEALMEKVKTEEAQKHEAEQDALEAQIHPHFIYNSISAIQYTAHMRNATDIEEAAVALSHLLHSVLSSRDALITLWEEHEYINSYMAIQRFKYKNNFTVAWEVEEKLWTLPIPKLLLQPIVENALIHGISMKENGTIIVNAYCEDEQVVFKIIDNGKGIEADTIKTLEKAAAQPRDTANTFRRVGLPNVLNRLQLIYGSSASYKITSTLGLFTCMEIRIPKERQAGQDG
jgi:Predicted signal transduction protein with a C-terminal ATPase domain